LIASSSQAKNVEKAFSAGDLGFVLIGSIGQENFEGLRFLPIDFLIAI
jgi:hypothetical protein